MNEVASISIEIWWFFLFCLVGVFCCHFRRNAIAFLLLAVSVCPFRPIGLEGLYVECRRDFIGNKWRSSYHQEKQPDGWVSVPSGGGVFVLFPCPLTYASVQQWEESSQSATRSSQDLFCESQNSDKPSSPRARRYLATLVRKSLAYMHSSSPLKACGFQDPERAHFYLRRVERDGEHARHSRWLPFAEGANQQNLGFSET